MWWAMLAGPMVNHVHGQLVDEADSEREAAIPHEAQEESLIALTCEPGQPCILVPSHLCHSVP